MLLERRNFKLELRAKEGDEGEGHLSGYAAVFNTLSHTIRDLWGDGFMEEIKPGAFDRALREKDHDIMALWSHDPSKPLASREGGSLDLSVDEKGLSFGMTVDQSLSWGKDAVASVRGKLAREMSMGFNVRGEEWNKRVDGKLVRTLTDIDLWEVSPVVFAAYPNTEVEARSALESYKQFLAKDERALSEAKTKAVAKFSFARARSNARRLAI